MWATLGPTQQPRGGRRSGSESRPITRPLGGYPSTGHPPLQRQVHSPHKHSQLAPPHPNRPCRLTCSDNLHNRFRLRHSAHYPRSLPLPLLPIRSALPLDNNSSTRPHLLRSRQRSTPPSPRRRSPPLHYHPRHQLLPSNLPRSPVALPEQRTDFLRPSPSMHTLPDPEESCQQSRGVNRPSSLPLLHRDHLRPPLRPCRTSRLPLLCQHNRFRHLRQARSRWAPRTPRLGTSIRIGSMSPHWKTKKKEAMPTKAPPPPPPLPPMSNSSDSA